MNDIVLNGETLEISEVVDSIVISGFDHTFNQNKVEGNLMIANGGSGENTAILDNMIVQISKSTRTIEVEV